MTLALEPATVEAASTEGADEGASEESEVSGEDDDAGASTCIVTVTRGGDSKRERD